MNKNTLLTLCILAIASISFAQNTPKSKLNGDIALGFGNSTLKHNLFGVLNGNVFSSRFNLSYPLSANENAKLVAGFETLDFHSHFYNGISQIKLKNEYLHLPIKITHRFALADDQKLYLLMGAGAYANFLWRSSLITMDDKINTKSGGVNFGLNLLAGMQYQVNSMYSISIYADMLNELNQIKKQNYAQKQTEIMLFHIGFSKKF